MTPYEFLTYAGTFTETFKYLLLLVGVIIEGPILMIACGFFLRLGALDIVPLFTVLFLGDLLADIAWYYVGVYFGQKMFEKHGKFVGITPERFEKVKDLFAHYHDRILLISKATIGFGMALAVLIVAGTTRVPFKRFILLNAIGEIVLVSALLSLGYVFGELYHNIAAGFRDFFAVAAVIMAGAALYGFSNYMKHRIADGK
ncbi:MAG: DedA family protein [Patescibacteria group bacterium]